ncbi:methyl-accepting chemotaxis protein [Hydrogenophaga sp. 5NK40-0174]|uniref:methyl-accepting chemotaxis protein n=1 Tax=Hydrogenophaga sp. 5NK40-0174 TaxID=3127649 RepID=UPI00334246D0
MSIWTNLSVVKRLYFTFALVGMLAVSALVFGYVQQSRASTMLDNIAGIEYDRAHEVAAWQLHATGTTVRIMALNRSTDPAVAMMFGPEIGPRVEKIQTYLDSIRQWATIPEEKAIIAEVDKLSGDILKALGGIEKARANNDNGTAVRLFEEAFMPPVTAYHAAIDRLGEVQQRKLRESIARQQERQWQRFVLGTGVVAACLVLAGLLITMVVRHIRSAMARAVATAEKVAEGDLTVRCKTRAQDEFGQLMNAMDRMAESLGGVVRHVRKSTDQLGVASAEIAQGNNDLSERTERQAGHLQQTTNTMAQLTDAVRHTSDNAGEATRLASSASQVAERGGEAVGRVVATMGMIEQSSRRIEEITSVIDGISFQTNILALNAAVEAARAGEQGRGFAVVAGEVRSLAQRSASAAKEIKSLIADSSDKVREGGEQVAAAGATMTELVQSVNQVSALIGEISRSANDQRSGIDGVGQSISEIDNSTQQNSALVEEAAAAANAMREQAGQLVRAVQRFRID